MRIGDLVTLSQYGKNLTSIPYAFKGIRRGPVIGIITDIRMLEAPSPGWYSENECTRYYIRWNEENLHGRDWRSKYFYRKDLKYIR